MKVILKIFCDGEYSVYINGILAALSLTRIMRIINFRKKRRVKRIETRLFNGKNNDGVKIVGVYLIFKQFVLN